LRLWKPDRTLHSIVMRAEYIGPDTVHVGMHIEVKQGLPIEKADRIAEEMRERVHRSVKGGYCITHVDAAGVP
jgi:divalent metal cation (Fe/Co/Zn/Cd) transporter